MQQAASVIDEGSTAGANVASAHRHVAAGEFLYVEGERRRCAFRVEYGTLAVFERRASGPALELVGSGDYAGLGCLEHHRDNARAVLDTAVSMLPRSQLSSLMESDAKLRLKQDEAIERDFEYGRALAKGCKPRGAIGRVAAFLVAVSRQNANEGQDPAIVSESLTCGSVAGFLDLEIPKLQAALVRLRSLGHVIEDDMSRLHLRNIPALEAIAFALLSQPSGSQVDSTFPAAEWQRHA
jgi:CRP/FNR family transcriptional regulator, anaerobic regulatory protein